MARELACVCMDRLLRTVLEQARRDGLHTAQQVADATGCGDQCTTCRPYIARMLATGVVPTTADLMDEAERARYSD